MNTAIHHIDFKKTDEYGILVYQFLIMFKNIGPRRTRIIVKMRHSFH